MEERELEIRKLITSNDLDMATKRLMDFVNELSINNRKRKNEAVIHRRTFVELQKDLRLYDKTTETHNRLTRLTNNLLELLDTVIEEYKNNYDENKKLNNLNIDENNKVNQQFISIEKAKKIFLENKKVNRTITLSNIIFQCSSLSKEYNDFLLHSINIKLEFGEILTVVGENASGKTTLLNLISGELSHNSGKISYPALQHEFINYYHIKQQISYINHEIPKWEGSLIDNLYFTTAINGIKGQDNIDEVEFMIYRLGLDQFINHKWDEISSGYKMRFLLAKAFLSKPKLLILDEPLANLDINAQQLFLKDLRDLVNSNKNLLSVVISSQHLYEVESIANKIIFLRNGSSKFSGDIKKIELDSKENLFEINCNIEKNELERCLEEVGVYCKVEIHGNNFIISTDLNIKSFDILKVLSKHKFEIKYFRNIGISARKFFREQYE